MKFSLLAVYFTEESWEDNKETIEARLLDIQEYYVKIALGLWIFKTREAYFVIHSLLTLFEKRNVPFVFLPIADIPPIVAVSPDVAQALEQLGMEVYNMSLQKT